MPFCNHFTYLCSLSWAICIPDSRVLLVHFYSPCGILQSLVRAPDLCTGRQHCERDNHKSELLTSCFRPISWQPQKRDNAEIAILMCAFMASNSYPHKNTPRCKHIACLCRRHRGIAFPCQKGSLGVRKNDTFCHPKPLKSKKIFRAKKIHKL